MPPANAEDLDPRSIEARQRALHALSLMRTQGLSITEAANEAGTTNRTVVKYVGPAIFRMKRGPRRYGAKTRDMLERELRFLTPDGITTVTVHDSLKASDIGGYWNAVDLFLKTGRDHELDVYRGQVLEVDEGVFPYVTDLSTIERLANVGEVSFEDLYAGTS